MRIVIPSVQVPFIAGGAELMTNGLAQALGNYGHQVEIIRFPFKFSPESYLIDLMEYCSKQDFTEFNGYGVDQVIALQFPSYYIQHENKVLWLMHQHRAVYDLFQADSASKSLVDIQNKIIAADSNNLAKISHRFSMCQNVSNRLKRYNNLASTPLYHPPFNYERFYFEDAYNYVFCPSRLEALKRQSLLIEAMRYVKSPIKAIIAGVGGQYETYTCLINKYDLQHKVKMIGHISENEKYVLYARSLGVFFAPYDEDYGYITLEAMLSSKPVITCTDSGGPLEFVVNNESGFILEPDPRQIAEKLDLLYYSKKITKLMGHNGKSLYNAKKISWANVVKTLVGGR